jgi:type I restriction enzyme S subunit
MSKSTITQTGGREATEGLIEGDVALAVGMPTSPAPNGWRWRKLTDLSRLETGHTPSRQRPEYWDGDIPWIGIRDATANHGRTLLDTNQHVTQEGINNSSARILPTNTVCLSRTASVGYVVVMGREMATSQDFVNWVCDESKLDHRFLKYVLLAENRSFSRFSHGTTHQTIYFPEVKAFHICVPAINEQRAIADVLSSLDDKIEQNRRTGRALEGLARATFKAWFVDFEPVKAKAAGQTSFPGMPPAAFAALPNRLTDSPLGPVPQGWEVRPLSEVCQIVSGGTPKRSEAGYWGGSIQWYSVKDVPPDGMPWVYFTDEQITEAGLDGSAATRVPVGCTIISARGTVGRLALAGRPMTFNQSCYGLLPKDGKSYRHLYLLVRQVVSELQQRSHGSVFDTITRQTFEGVKVVLPPPALIDRFEFAVTPLFDSLLALLRESTKLAELRDYLLPRLLSGTVRVEARNG